jgi:hypothetical protein
MNIFELYKEHINPEADGLEFHQFAQTWGIHKLAVSDPSPSMNEFNQRDRDARRSEAIEWILKNSKL